jgi:hypothetical protein
MPMSPRIRKFALTAHVAVSVGWLGAVAVFLALALSGLMNARAHAVQAAYVAMEVSTWFVIVPLALACLLTGLVQGLGTSWGLFRHYWVVAKLLLNVVATVLLLLHTQPISRVAAAAAAGPLAAADLRQVRVQLVADAVLALLALIVATTLSVYKPWGMTPYGKRGQQEWIAATPLWVKVSGLIALAFVLLVAILHLTGHGLGGH